MNSERRALEELAVRKGIGAADKWYDQSREELLAVKVCQEGQRGTKRGKEGQREAKRGRGGEVRRERGVRLMERSTRKMYYGTKYPIFFSRMDR